MDTTQDLPPIPELLENLDTVTKAVVENIIEALAAIDALIASPDPNYRTIRMWRKVLDLLFEIAHAIAARPINA
jgi:hypothetical protein